MICMSDSALIRIQLVFILSEYGFSVNGKSSLMPGSNKLRTVPEAVIMNPDDLVF